MTSCNTHFGHLKFTISITNYYQSDIRVANIGIIPTVTVNTGMLGKSIFHRINVSLNLLE